MPAFVFEKRHECFSMNQVRPISFIEVDVRVGKQKGRAFLDSGCTFNAISFNFEDKCGLTVRDMGDSFVCTVGGGKSVEIKKMVTHVCFDLGHLGSLETEVLVRWEKTLYLVWSFSD